MGLGETSSNDILVTISVSFKEKSGTSITINLIITTEIHFWHTHTQAVKLTGLAAQLILSREFPQTVTLHCTAALTVTKAGEAKFAFWSSMWGEFVPLFKDSTLDQSTMRRAHGNKAFLISKQRRL